MVQGGMATTLDVRSVPDRVLKAYLYPLGGWGIGLLFLFAAGETVWAITLCYPLALWYGGLTAWWAMDTRRRRDIEGLRPEEIDAGVRSVGRILAGSAMAPAIVFMTLDPLSPSTWGTVGSIALVTAIAWGLANALPKLKRRVSHTAAIVVAWAALPLNATGALSLAFWLGLLDEVRGVVTP